MSRQLFRLLTGVACTIALTVPGYTQQQPQPYEGKIGRTLADSTEWWPQPVRAPAGAPNVVWILLDDVGYGASSAFGGEVSTPAMDWLAQNGLRYTNFHTTGICAPSRAALLTGRYPMRHGLQVGVVKPWAQYGLPLEEHTLADDLKAAGYVTGIFGKWHLGHFQPEYLPTNRGFMHQYGQYNGALDYFTHEREGGFDWHEDGKVCHDQGYSTALIGEHAAKFVAQNAGKIV